MAGAWKCCTKKRYARALWEQVKRRLRRLDAWRTLRKMRAAQTNPANIAMAGLDEGFAIACAGTYQAHFEAFAACACDGKLWNARRRAAALGSARFRAVGPQQTATKNIAHTQPLCRNSPGPCRLRSQRRSLRRHQVRKRSRMSGKGFATGITASLATRPLERGPTLGTCRAASERGHRPRSQRPYSEQKRSNAIFYSQASPKLASMLSAEIGSNMAHVEHRL